MSTTYLSLVYYWSKGNSECDTHLNKSMFDTVEEYVNWMKDQCRNIKDSHSSMTVRVFDSCDEKTPKYIMIVPMPYDYDRTVEEYPTQCVNFVALCYNNFRH